MSAYWKIPLQALVMIIGVLMFVFYLFTPPPMLFNNVHDKRVAKARGPAEYVALEQKFQARAIDERRAAAAVGRGERRAIPRPSASTDQAFTAAEQRSRRARARPSRWSRMCRGDSTYNDVNYVFPTYIVTQLPVGLVGLLMAAIFAAAMSTIAGELSALSTSTVIDFYRRWVRDDGDETHLLWVSKVAMLFWAVFASIVAILAGGARLADRSRQSFRIVLLRIDPRRVPAGDRLEARELHGAFVGLIAGMSVVGYVAAIRRSHSSGTT